MKEKFLALIAMLSAAGCSTNHPKDFGANTKANGFETVKIEKGEITSSIKLPGQLKAFERVDIYPKVNGFVKEINVDRGSFVHSGDILMTLEAPEIEQQLQAATAKYLEAQETLNASRDRYLRLKMAGRKSGAISEVDMVGAQSKFQADSAFLQSEKANMSDLQTMKDYLVIRAPFDGVITERNIHPGALTGPSFKSDNKPLLILEDNRKLRLETFVPEEYVQQLDPHNKQITFTTGALPGRTFSAAISRTSNSLNDDYRSEAIEADVLNADNNFKPGMYVEARLAVSTGVSSFIVPATAVITSTEKKYVVVNENGRAKFIAVTTGITNKGKTEVYGDFSGNELIIKEPTLEIKEASVLNEK